MSANPHGKRFVLAGASRGVGHESTMLFLKASAYVVGSVPGAKRLANTTEAFKTRGQFTPVLVDPNDRSAPATMAVAAIAHRNAHRDALGLLGHSAAVQVFEQDGHAQGLELPNAHWRINVFAQHGSIYRLVPLLRKGLDARVIYLGSGGARGCAARNTRQGPRPPGQVRFTACRCGGQASGAAKWLSTRSNRAACAPTRVATTHRGEPADGVRRTLEVCALPRADTSNFWHGSQQINN
jgi:NAD(P)-dependent dehydrogenase (short-subunit alcohol dehydrogenase family)